MSDWKKREIEWRKLLGYAAKVIKTSAREDSEKSISSLD